jgi:hypothetical protein
MFKSNEVYTGQMDKLPGGYSVGSWGQNVTNTAAPTTQAKKVTTTALSSQVAETVLAVTTTAADLLLPTVSASDTGDDTTQPTAAVRENNVATARGVCRVSKAKV